MQMAYRDTNIFCNFSKFVFEKLDFWLEMPPEKEVLWIFFFGQEWNIFILPFLDTLGARAYRFQKNMVSGLGIFLVFWPFQRTVGRCYHQ